MANSESGLYELLYVSCAVQPMEDKDLVPFLLHGHRYNAEHGITGVLLYCNRSFMQLIEGPYDEALRLFARIKEDKRHHQVNTLLEGPIAARTFPDWYMGFKSITRDQLVKVRGYTTFLDIRNPQDEDKSKNTALRILETFKAVHEFSGPD